MKIQFIHSIPCHCVGYFSATCLRSSRSNESPDFFEASPTAICHPARKMAGSGALFAGEDEWSSVPEGSLQEALSSWQAHPLPSSFHLRKDLVNKTYCSGFTIVGWKVQPHRRGYVRWAVSIKLCLSVCVFMGGAQKMWGPQNEPTTKYRPRNFSCTLFWIARLLYHLYLFSLRVFQFGKLLNIIWPEWLIYLVAGYSVFSMMKNSRQ